ncbi:MAG: 3-hydroxy acid dehydrogenase/malonic semialdehyde reductase, partial [Candidatus Paceibacteria bacterium]
MKRLQNRLALVTGASKGIGRATARALAAEGAQVILAARRPEPLEELAAELEGALVAPLDVTDAEGTRAAIRAVLPAGRHVDLAVLNAGLARGAEPLQQGDPGEWSEVVDTNIKGVLHGLHAVLRPMIEGGTG